MKYLMRQGEHPSGNARYYVRRTGFALIAMPDAPMDAPKFLAAYAAALAEIETNVRHVQHPTGTIGAGVRAYIASDTFLALRPTTRETWRRLAEKIEAAYGRARLRDLKPIHIRKDLSNLQPNPANNRLKIWRSMCRFWVAAGLMEHNPAKEVEKVKTPKTAGHKPWSRDDVTAFRKRWGVTTHQRLAFELMYRTCAAIGDVCRIGPQNVDDGWLQYSRSKSDVPSMAPMTPDLAPPWFEFNPDFEQCLKHHPRHMTYLTTHRGAPRSPKAATQWFASACREAGLSVTAHGIRKHRAVTFRENGATVEQRMVVLGHDTEQMAAYYSRSADLKKIISGTDFANASEHTAKTAKK